MSDNYMSDPRAKTFEGVLAALSILARHSPEGLKQRWPLDAGYDVISSHIDADEISESSADGRELEALGWHYDDELEAWAYFT